MSQAASITRAGIWREVLEFVRLPLPLLPVGRGRFFDHNIWPDFRVFRIPDVHHDALEFPNGEIVLVSRLRQGQHATVLQLPASPRAANETEGQKRGSLVA